MSEEFKLLDKFIGNVDAMTLGQIALEVGKPDHPAVGDSIDRGLILRRRLEEEGFFVFKLLKQKEI